MQKFIIALLILLLMFGCSPMAATPTIQASPTEVTAAATTQLIPSVTVEPSATLEPDFPEGCIKPTETHLDTSVLNGRFVVVDSKFSYRHQFFLDPNSNQLIDMEKQIPLSWDAPKTDVTSAMVSPNKKFIQVNVWDKRYGSVRSADEVINTDSTQGQDDWNRPRWLDNERMVFQLWFDAPYGSYTIVIYNPFTGEQKNMQIDLPNPYIEKDTGGRVTWVKADIDPSLKWVLYNDKEERLVLWDLENEKEIASVSSPTDVTDGKWSPDGSKFAIPRLSPTYDPTEYYIIAMDGTIKETHFNQKYPIANVETRPAWSPDGRYIAFQLKISNVPNRNPDTLRQWVAIMDITTLDTQIYCLSGEVVWSPDSTHVVINTPISSEKAKPVLVDLTRQTQTTLDTHELPVVDWMAP